MASKQTAGDGTRRHGWLWHEVPYVLVVSLFVLSAVVAERVLGDPDMLRLELYHPRLPAGLALYLLVIVVLHASRILLVERRSMLQAVAWSRFVSRHLDVRRAFRAILVLALIPPLLSTFASFKRMIPTVNPFSWDERFMQLDAWLHLGTQPWEWLLPVLRSAPAIGFIDFVYTLWFPVVVMTLVWQAWSGREPARSRFFLAFALTWILLGVVAATFFSSAGPCYYGRIVAGPDPYEALMKSLYRIDSERPLTALMLQEFLFRGYSGAAAYRIEGISAMPSLHVAIAALLVLLFARVNRTAMILAAGFGMLILLGSVVLGWHYAVDGYVAALLVLPVWWLAGWIQRSAGLGGSDGGHESATRSHGETGKA